MGVISSIPREALSGFQALLALLFVYSTGLVARFRPNFYPAVHSLLKRNSRFSLIGSHEIL
jgi:hypothetical protein